MAEEDSGYRQLQMLQDAGILPVRPKPATSSLGLGGMAAGQPSQQKIDDALMEQIRKEDE